LTVIAFDKGIGKLRLVGMDSLKIVHPEHVKYGGRGQSVFQKK